jgi:hypothetical protein
LARPELLVLDEPTAGIDPLVQVEVHRLVEEARDEGRTVFLSSHTLSEVQRVADEIVVLRRGRVVATGDVDELRQGVRQGFTVWFSGPPPEDEPRRAAGVHDVDVRDREVTGYVDGPPNELLAVLARHPVEHLLLPEADLEQAFLRYWAPAVGLAILVLVAGYVVSLVLPLADALGGARRWSPWYWALGRQPVSDGVDASRLLLLVAVTVALAALGVWGVGRRDIRSA